LDITESLVNKILPPELTLIPVIESGEDVDDEEQSEDSGIPNYELELIQQNNRLNSNPLPRIKEMSTGVTKRLRHVAMSKLGSVSLRSQRQIDSMAYVVDLIQYAADYIDLEGKTKVFKENASQVQNYLGEKREEASKLMTPAREIIEQQTADIKEHGIKAVVTVVSSIAHATEVVRRQLANTVPAVSALQERLKDITVRTKEAVLKLKGAELADYLTVVRDSCKTALHSIIEITSTYAPERLTESRLIHKLAESLSSWKISLTARLAMDPHNEDKKDGSRNEVETQLPTNTASINSQPDDAVKIDTTKL